MDYERAQESRQHLQRAIMSASPTPRRVFDAAAPSVQREIATGEQRWPPTYLEAPTQTAAGSNPLARKLRQSAARPRTRFDQMASHGCQGLKVQVDGNTIDSREVIETNGRTIGCGAIGLTPKIISSATRSSRARRPISQLWQPLPLFALRACGFEEADLSASRNAGSIAHAGTDRHLDAKLRSGHRFRFNTTPRAPTSARDCRPSLRFRTDALLRRAGDPSAGLPHRARHGPTRWSAGGSGLVSVLSVCSRFSGCRQRPFARCRWANRDGLKRLCGERTTLRECVSR